MALLSRVNIEQLFDVFIEIYGRAFIKKYGIEDSGIWIDILGTLTMSDIQYGINKIKNIETGGKFHEYPPSPLEFKSLCKGFDEEHRIPSVADAFREALYNLKKDKTPNWSHAAVQATAYKLAVELDEEPEYIVYPKFKYFYEIAVQGLKHEDKPILITDRPQLTKQNTRSVGESHLANLYQYLGVKQ